MKKFYILSVFIMSLINGYSQTQITLTFHAIDSITQNLLALDSVNIKNLTENIDTTLYDSVSVLNLLASWPVGTGEPALPGSESFIIQQNVPNPFHGTTQVKVWLKNEGELNLSLYDNQGRTLSQYSSIFKKGWQQFAITTSASGFLLFRVNNNITTKTIKLLSAGGNEGERISFEGQSYQGSIVKSAQDATGFIFYLGNQLQYTAYVGGYTNRILLDNPVSSEDYAFTMQLKGFSCGDSLEYGGQYYNTVLIGDQCWFKENLNIGTRINGGVNQANNSVIEKYCYGNQTSNCDVYGGLYQWDETMQYSTIEGVRGICPEGWHIPTAGEFTTLITFLGGENVAGGAMKEVGTVHWAPPNTGATNSSGFTGLPGGLWNSNGYFDYFPLAAWFWSSSQASTYESNMCNLFYTNTSAFTGSILKSNGFSVRCIKD